MQVRGSYAHAAPNYQDSSSPDPPPPPAPQHPPPASNRTAAVGRQGVPMPALSTSSSEQLWAAQSSSRQTHFWHHWNGRAALLVHPWLTNFTVYHSLHFPPDPNSSEQLWAVPAKHTFDTIGTAEHLPSPSLTHWLHSLPLPTISTRSEQLWAAPSSYRQTQSWHTWNGRPAP